MNVASKAELAQAVARIGLPAQYVDKVLALVVHVRDDTFLRVQPASGFCPKCAMDQEKSGRVLE